MCPDLCVGFQVHFLCLQKIFYRKDVKMKQNIFLGNIRGERGTHLREKVVLSKGERARIHQLNSDMGKFQCGEFVPFAFLKLGLQTWIFPQVTTSCLFFLCR